MALGIEHGEKVVDEVEALDSDGGACEADAEGDVLEDDVDVDDESSAHLLRRKVVHLGDVGIPRALIERRQRSDKVAFRVVVLAEQLSEELRRRVRRHLLEQRLDLILSRRAFDNPLERAGLLRCSERLGFRIGVAERGFLG